MAGSRALLVLYGSQTGCAQEVAERIAWEGKRRFFCVRLAGMDEYDVMSLPSETLVVICASTTGQGDAPDNMRSFWSFLLRRSLGADSLCGTSFAVFGLGDSGYAKYNAVAKRLDKRLEMLGAQRIVPLGLGDDQDRAGYDQALDPWLASMWDAALKLMPLPPGAVIDTSDSLPPSRYLVSPAAAEGTSAGAEMSDVTRGDHGTPSARRPFMSLIVKNEVLTAAESEKEVLHLELDIEGSGMRYQPGDIVAIQPRNADEQVRAMAEMCDLDLDASVTVVPNREAQSGEEDGIREPGCGWGTVSVRDVLTRHLDFMATPRRRFFQLLPFFCPDEVQRERLEELASKDGRVDLYDYCHKVGRSALEVLRDFPAARPPLHYLMELMPGLRPRLFSISSGPSCTPGRLSITVGIVDYKSKTLMHRRGVCSGFLKAQGAQLHQLGVRQDERGRVPIWIQEGSLRLPQRKVADKCAAGEARRGPEVEPCLSKAAAELATPLVLVGPGTGLAPLRSFLQERRFVRTRLVDQTGPAAGGQGVAKAQDLLFFGCRRRGCDYLYRQELEGLLSDGHLRHLGVAFSRDQPHKVYVQDKIREAGALVWSALEAGAVVMISGASEKMPRDVREAFVAVVEAQSGQGAEYAEAYVKRLEAQRRYLLDTWS